MLATWALFITSAIFGVAVGSNDTDNSSENDTQGFVNRTYVENLTNPYVQEIDRDVAQWARDAKILNCQSGFRGEPKATREDLARELGGESNLIVEALEVKGDTDDGADIKTTVQEELMQGWIFFKAAPLVFSAITAVMWIFCCWTACCPRCRCCAKERVHGDTVKACMLVVSVICLAACYMTLLGTNAGYSQIEDGADNLICTATELLYLTLSGQAQDHHLALAGVGVDACDYGTTPSKEACLMAAFDALEEAGRTKGGGYEVVSEGAYYPPGCSVRSGSNNDYRIFFMETSSGDNNGFFSIVCSGKASAATPPIVSQGDPKFFGVVPILDRIVSVDNQLSDGSPLLTELDLLLDETAEIEDAVVLATDLLKLLDRMLNFPGNVWPMTPGNASASISPTSLYHECGLCLDLAPLVAEVSEGVSNGVAESLSGFRDEVGGQFSPSRRAELQDALRASLEPLLELKDQTVGRLKPFVDPEAKVNELKEEWMGMVSLSFYVILGLAAGFSCCGCCSVSAWLWKPKKENGTYVCCPSCCACQIWCYSFLFLFVVFGATGIMNVALVPTAGICVLLQDLDGTLLADIGAGLNISMSGDRGTMVKDVVDVCYAGKAVANRSFSLLDVFFVRDDFGEKAYLREKLIGAVLDPVDAKFAEIQARVDAGTFLIGSTRVFGNLTDTLSLSSIAATLMPVRDELLAAIPDIVRDGGRLEVAFATSSACDDQDALGSETKGIHNFVSTLKTIPGVLDGVSISHDCIEPVNCTGVVSADQKQACLAGNAFIDVKRRLMEGDLAIGGEERLFRCDIFVNPQNTTLTCDPARMVQVNGSWAGDCLAYNESGNPFMMETVRFCNLKEFNEYIQTFSTTLDLAIGRLDNATTKIFNKLSRELPSVLNKYVLDHVREVSDGMSCGFLHPLRQEMINGMCYQSLDGFKIMANSYLLTALFNVLLALDMYFLFRLHGDNYTLQRKEQRDAEREANRAAEPSAEEAPPDHDHPDPHAAAEPSAPPDAS